MREKLRDKTAFQKHSLISQLLQWKPETIQNICPWFNNSPYTHTHTGKEQVEKAIGIYNKASFQTSPSSYKVLLAVP